VTKKGELCRKVGEIPIVSFIMKKEQKLRFLGLFDGFSQSNLNHVLQKKDEYIHFFLVAKESSDSPSTEDLSFR
jgi:hypothetical protein